MGDFDGHPFRGNQYTTATGAQMTALETHGLFDAPDGEEEHELLAAIDRSTRRIYAKDAAHRERLASAVNQISNDLDVLSREHPDKERAKWAASDSRALSNLYGKLLIPGAPESTIEMAMRLSKENPVTLSPRQAAVDAAHVRALRGVNVSRGDYKQGNAGRRLTAQIKQAGEESKRFIGPPQDPFRGFR